MASTNTKGATPTTPQAIAQELAELSPITPTRPASGIVPRAKIGTPYLKADGTVGKLTDKTKQCLGIPLQHMIIWAHANFGPEDYGIFTAFAKSQRLEVAELAARIVLQWLEANRSEVEKHADGFVKAEMTIETLTAKRDKARREYERMMAAIEALTAAEAETASIEEAEEAAAETTETGTPPAPAVEEDDFPTEKEVMLANKARAEQAAAEKAKKGGR